MVEQITIYSSKKIPELSVIRNGAYQSLKIPFEMMDRVQEFIAIIEAIRSPEELAKEQMADQFAAHLPDDKILEFVNIFPEYNPREYVKAGKIRQYQRRLYRTVQDYKGVGVEDPEQHEAWERVGANLPPKAYSRPRDIDTAYRKGDRITYNGKVFDCILEPTFHNPDEFPAAWQEVAE